MQRVLLPAMMWYMFSHEFNFSDVVVNDILPALDNDNISVLLLDLSAAFDTTDHQIILSRMNSVFGIQSTALQWFQSSLSRNPLVSVKLPTSPKNSMHAQMT